MDKCRILKINMKRLLENLTFTAFVKENHSPNIINFRL